MACPLIGRSGRDGRRRGLPGGSGDVGGDDVGGVTVEAGARPVLAHGGARVGVGRGFLHVPQRHPGIERRGDERVSQRVRSYVLTSRDSRDLEGRAAGPSDERCSQRTTCAEDELRHDP
jgi:hypothetical protein